MRPAVLTVLSCRHARAASLTQQADATTRRLVCRSAPRIRRRPRRRPRQRGVRDTKHERAMWHAAPRAARSLRTRALAGSRLKGARNPGTRCQEP